jgi:uncharacterized protein YdaU (DUF1376 family)
MTKKQEKPPAFQFYAAEFLADENVVLMTNQELGCYIKLMAYCWREKSIPSDINKIAKLCGEPMAELMAKLWLAIGCCFVEVEGYPDRLCHPRLIKEYIKQQTFKTERSISGVKGAEARWARVRAEKENGKLSHSSAIKEPMAKNGSSSSSSIYKARTKPRSVDNWWTTHDGIKAKALEIGLESRPGETWDGITHRIRAKLAVCELS